MCIPVGADLLGHSLSHEECPLLLQVKYREQSMSSWGHGLLRLLAISTHSSVNWT